MNRCSSMEERGMGRGIELEVVAWRILKLAELAMLEHVEALLRSQAMGLAASTDAEEFTRIGV